MTTTSDTCEHTVTSVEEVPVIVMVDGDTYQETSGIKCTDCGTVLGTNI